MGPCLVGIGYAHCCEDNGGLSEDRTLGMHTDCSAHWQVLYTLSLPGFPTAYIISYPQAVFPLASLPCLRYNCKKLLASNHMQHNSNASPHLHA